MIHLGWTRLNKVILLWSVRPARTRAKTWYLDGKRTMQRNREYAFATYETFVDRFVPPSSFLFTAYRALDANRRLMQRDKGSNAHCSLGPGWSYFAEPQSLQRELRRIEGIREPVNQADEVRTCLHNIYYRD